MTPSLYDLLDVEPTATTDEIRAAWKAAIADLDPTDRRFRAFSQAAETLLDPEKRAAYDATLAEEDRAEEDRAEEDRAEEPEPEPEEVPEPQAEPEPVAPPAPVSRRLLVVAVVLAVLAVAGTAWVWTRPGAQNDPGRFDAREEGAWQAESVAADAVVPVLSYDFRHLDDDVARATPYLTDEYAEEYRGLIDELAPQARKAKLVVQAESIASGIVRSGDDRAEILVFVNQESTRAGKKNEPLRMWVTLSMVHEDTWLIDEMKVDTAVPG